MSVDTSLALCSIVIYRSSSNPSVKRIGLQQVKRCRRIRSLPSNAQPCISGGVFCIRSRVPHIRYVLLTLVDGLVQKRQSGEQHESSHTKQHTAPTAAPYPALRRGGHRLAGSFGLAEQVDVTSISNSVYSEYYIFCSHIFVPPKPLIPRAGAWAAPVPELHLSLLSMPHAWANACIAHDHHPLQLSMVQCLLLNTVSQMLNWVSRILVMLWPDAHLCLHTNFAQHYDSHLL